MYINAPATEAMNAPLFAVAAPSAIVAAVAHLFTAYFLSRKPESDRRVAWGPLFARGPFSCFVVSYVVSATGCCISFFLFLQLPQPEYLSLLIFFFWNLSVAVFDYALLHSQVAMAGVCVVSNCICSIMLFAYTGVVFGFTASEALPPAVVVAHLGNAIGVVHVTVLDLYVWYDAWRNALYRARPPDLLALWAGAAAPENSSSPFSKTMPVVLYTEQMRL